MVSALSALSQAAGCCRFAARLTVVPDRDDGSATSIRGRLIGRAAELLMSRSTLLALATGILKYGGRPGPVK
jgi:hypothetical protein